MRRFLFLLLTAGFALTGCSAGDASPDQDTEDELRKVDPDQVPSAIVGFEDRLDWGTHHLQWHMERRWDSIAGNRKMLDYAQAHGWSKSSHQEGEKDNGLEFLVMHRAMLEILREKFPTPATRALFDGFDKIPTDPHDHVTPCPTPDAFDTKMVASVKKLEEISANAADFEDDDAFGRYLETSMHQRKAGAGRHNKLPRRFAKDGSPIDVGDPTLNLKNKVFWRIHGWIDRKWSEFRAAKGLPAEDADLRKAIDEVKAHMLEGRKSRVTASMGDVATEQEIRSAFLEGLRDEFR